MTDQPPVGVALKPCPFCGDDTIHTRIIETTDPDDPYVYHECDRCQVETAARDREEAIEALNTRTPASGAVEAARIDHHPRGLAALVAGKEALFSCCEDPTLNDARGCWVAMNAALTSSPKAEGEAAPCRHEPYQGACVHCGVPFVDGRPRYPAPQPLQGGEVTREIVAYLEYEASSAEEGAVRQDEDAEEWATNADPWKASRQKGCRANARRLREDAAKYRRWISALISPARREGEDA